MSSFDVFNFHRARDFLLRQYSEHNKTSVTELTSFDIYLYVHFFGAKVIAMTLAHIKKQGRIITGN